MKKILLVSGCSFTTDNFISTFHPEIDCSWEKWPHILAEKLDMTCINLAQSGSGNEFVYSSLIDKIESMDKSKIGLVIPAWSQCQRRDFQLHNRHNHPRWRAEMYDTFGDIQYWIKKSLRYYHSFQIYCEYNKIPYKQTQMIELYKDYLWERCHPNYSDSIKASFDMILESPHYSKLNDKSFIGTPKIVSNVQDDLTRGRTNDINFRVSKEDRHPNENGQKMIAEYIYENL